MTGTFAAEKYVLAAGMTWIVKKMFGKRKHGNTMLCAVTMAVSIMAMNWGAGLFFPTSREKVVGWIAEGIFAGSLVALLEMLGDRRRRKKVYRKSGTILESPGKERISHYTKAFSDLAKTFLSVPVKNSLALAGTDEYSRVHAVWNCRMEEQRVAVAHQLNEISCIMEEAVKRAYATREDKTLEVQLKRKLYKKGILLKRVYVYENGEGKLEVYLNSRTRRRKCISNKDVAEVLTEVLGCPMMPAKDARAFVGNEFFVTCFVEHTNYEVLYGVEREAGDRQQISGDSFSFFYQEEGAFLASLSDGMGTGLIAYQESEKVVDLLEQFLEAGFSKETAVKMINSALVLRSEGQRFSTMDIASFDLYTGVCEFLKIGACTSFIRRDSWVETISSSSLPAGIFQQMDLEKHSRKLYDGDMVIMVTDGVMDGLPGEYQEERMKEIIMEHPTNNPKELANYILNRAKQYQGKGDRDDMTVLVIGIWKR